MFHLYFIYKPFFFFFFLTNRTFAWNISNFPLSIFNWILIHTIHNINWFSTFPKKIFHPLLFWDKIYHCPEKWLYHQFSISRIGKLSRNSMYSSALIVVVIIAVSFRLSNDMQRHIHFLQAVIFMRFIWTERDKSSDIIDLANADSCFITEYQSVGESPVMLELWGMRSTPYCPKGVILV